MKGPEDQEVYPRYPRSLLCGRRTALGVRPPSYRDGLLLIPIVAADLLAQLALHEVTLQRREAINEEQAVDVVDLVAEGARQQVGRRVDALLAVEVEALHDHARGAHRRPPEAGHGQASLLVPLLALP